jgi:hypothetical protein
MAIYFAFNNLLKLAHVKLIYFYTFILLISMAGKCLAHLPIVFKLLFKLLYQQLIDAGIISFLHNLYN